jgi:hypothetical protein
MHKDLQHTVLLGTALNAVHSACVLARLCTCTVLYARCVLVQVLLTSAYCNAYTQSVLAQCQWQSAVLTTYCVFFANFLYIITGNKLGS